MNSRLICLAAVALWCLCLAGCQKRRERPETGAFESRTASMYLVVLLDLSGSFEKSMAPDGDAYRNVSALLDVYFGNRSDDDDLLLISQISGVNQPHLFNGSPKQFRRKFSSPQEFHRFLRSKADNTASRVHDSIADSIEFVLHSPSVDRTKTRIGVCVFSDMLKNVGGQAAAQRIGDQLRLLSSYRSFVGLYFVDPSYERMWREGLANCGFGGTRARVSASFDDTEHLPRF